MENIITRVEAMRAFEDLRNQACDVPEMTLEEINAEISAVREEKRGREGSAPYDNCLL